MNDDQWIIMFVMALIFILANDFMAFFVWYFLYKESLTVTVLDWPMWTLIFMVFYFVIKGFAVRMGWQTKGSLIGGDK